MSGGKILKEACTPFTPSFPFYRWGTWDQQRGCLAKFSRLTMISEWKQRTGVRRTEHPDPGFWVVSRTPLMGPVCEVSSWALADRTVPWGVCQVWRTPIPEGGCGTPGGRLGGDFPNLEPAGSPWVLGQPQNTQQKAEEASCATATTDIIPTAAS